ncbi:mitochondrial carrier domain-containing protein [Lipomyces orientalis]|uniref:Mitochondrial carrier domain-containing protein n=1 Tax=Lipomyces orientalis TaxID=1233043 RepID=A0ACC3TT74_9ASCO
MDLATIAAAVAGAVGSRVAFHPLDTIRTLQQTSVATGYRLPFAQYWRGLPAAVGFTTPAFTIYLVSYRQAKKDLEPYLGNDTALNYIVSGAIAEFTSSVLWTPMEVVKGNMQLKSESKTGGTWAMIKQMYQTQGLKGFYRGYWVGLAVFTPHSIVWWYTYEKMKIYLKSTNALNESLAGSTSSSLDLTASQYAIASAVSGTAAGTASNFLDVLKTRQQLAIAVEVSRLRPDDQLGLWKVAKNLIREVGIVRAMFKGLHVRLMYSLPSGILSMVIVEKLKPEG